MGTSARARRLKQIGTENGNVENGNIANCLRYVLNCSPLFALPTLFHLVEIVELFPLCFFVALVRGAGVGVVGPVHRLLNRVHGG